MYEQESVMLAEAFNDLQVYYSQVNINAFLRSCWLLPESQKLTLTSIERLIYIDGDQQEIYTSRERQHIKDLRSDVYLYRYLINTQSGIINSRIIAIELENTRTPILDAIATMKIINKALDGFNTFVFVCGPEIYLGCSALRTKRNSLDCIISPPIVESMDWDLLADVFLYRDDSESFYQYYHGLVTTFKAIGYCYKEEPSPYVCESYGYGDEDYPDAYYDINEHLNGSAYHNYEASDNELTTFDIDAFEREVDTCKCELEYIVSSHTNPLELLFEAEEALAIAERQEAEAGKAQSSQGEANLSDVALLDDPIALMKKLKKERGLG